REIEPARAGISLTAGAAAQLVVDAPRLVALGADDVQTALGENLLVASSPILLERRELLLGRALEPRPLGFEIAAKHDIRAAACHVGGDRHGARAAGLHDDLG